MSETSQTGQRGTQASAHGLRVVVWAALAVCCAIATVSAHLPVRRDEMPSPPVELASAEYTYGFASAALTACPLHPGPKWGALEGVVALPGTGELPPELSRGFATFSALSEALGLGAVCDQTLAFFGPSGSARQDLLRTATTRLR